MEDGCGWALNHVRFRTSHALHVVHGVDKTNTLSVPPSPSSPPTEGRGDLLGLRLFYYGLLSNKLEVEKFVYFFLGDIEYGIRRR